MYNRPQIYRQYDIYLCILGLGTSLRVVLATSDLNSSK